MEPDRRAAAEADRPSAPRGAPPARSGAAAGGPRRRRAASSARMRRHPFRIVGAIVALLVLWFLFALFQPFHGDGSRPGRGDDPERRQRQRSRRPARREGRDRQLDPVPDPRHPRRQALRPLRRATSPSPTDMSYGAAIDALSKPPVKTRRPRSRSPRATAARRRRQLVEEDGARRQLHEGDGAARKYLEPGQVRRQGRQEPRGLPLPRHLRTEAEGAGRRPRPAAAAGLQAADQGRRHELREVEEPDRLRRAHDRLDDRARGRGRRASASWSPRSIYNRLHEGMPLGIDATIRFATGNYERAADRIGAGGRLALQHAHQRRPAAGADQQPRPGRDRGRRAPGQDRLPLLREQAGRRATNSPSPRPKPNSKPTSPRYNEAREANGGNAPTTCGE